MSLPTHRPEKKILSNWLLRLLQGIMIGTGAILPGISGGVLCVSFGLYRPIMAVLAHPKQNFKKYLGLLLPVGIGGLLGFVAFVRLLDLFFDAEALLASCLFFGLIAGTFPGLYRQAGMQGRKRGDWLAFAISFLLLVVSFLTAIHWVGIRLQPGFSVFVGCGALLGLGVVVPGLAASSILISLEIYQPVINGISALDMSVLIPLGIGVVGLLLLAARFVNHMFEHHHSKSFHVVLGVVAASLLAVLSSLLPAMDFHSASGLLKGLLGLALAVAGAAVALWMNRLELKLK